jgi:hypothetical protein
MLRRWLFRDLEVRLLGTCSAEGSASDEQSLGRSGGVRRRVEWERVARLERFPRPSPTVRRKLHVLCCLNQEDIRRGV